MAGKENWHKRAADKQQNNPDASGQPASPSHAWGLPPRVVEEPARPDCGIGGHRAGANRRAGTAAGAHKNRCDCCPPAA